MRLAFLGTPEAAVPTLEALCDAGHDVRVVVTRPDRRRGRGGDVSPAPVKRAALERGLEVVEDVATLMDHDVEWGVVVAYGAMVPAATLARIPMLNVHFSLLPRWRGAAPVERAILAGDVETGVSVMSLEETLDTGPVHAEARVEVGDKTASALTAELALVGAQLVVSVLDDAEVLAHPRPQSGEATYAAKVTPETFHLRPEMGVEEAGRVVRLERAFTRVEGRRLKILRARPADFAVVPGQVRAEGSRVALGLAHGALELLDCQPEGSREMSAVAWWAGARLGDGVEWG